MSEATGGADRAVSSTERAARARANAVEESPDPTRTGGSCEPAPEGSAAGPAASSRPLSPAERRAYGRSLREHAPLESHAEWAPGPERVDPIALIEAQNESRIDWLVPVRRARMSASAFTFYRGAARIMASDLSTSPVSGLACQICGDAHLANFGMYASPERRLVFDLNDFDETLVGPWEWDVKRLAASFFIAGRFNGLGRKDSRKLARTTVRHYREAMRRLAKMRRLDVWYDLVEAKATVEAMDDRASREASRETIEKAMRKDSRAALDSLAEEVDGDYHIRPQPPFVVRLRDLRDEASRDPIGEWIQASFEAYKRSVTDDVAVLLEQFRPVDFAVKVVGVGSVGTRCFILLLQGRDRHDPLFLQIKEAGPSALEEFLPACRYVRNGQRVVEGQRLMQTVSDIFLGHVDTDAGRDFYWRQLKDWKGSDDVEDATGDSLEGFAETRGYTLARAHARAGDPSAIAGYLGKSDTFDRAVAQFAERYARQNGRDYEAFKAEIDAGRLEAAEYE